MSEVETEGAAPTPYIPKNGPIILNLEVNEEIKPISFLVEVLQGSEYIQTFPYPRPAGVVGANQKPVLKLGLAVVYRADMDESNKPEPRCLVLVEPGEWVSGLNILGSFRSMINGKIFAIGELPVNEEQRARYDEMCAARDAENAAAAKAAEEAAKGIEPNTDAGQERKQTAQDVVDFLSAMKARRRPSNDK